MSVGIKSVAVVFPDNPVTNEDLRKGFPEIVETAERRILAKLWGNATSQDPVSKIYNEVLAPYAQDPFRGSLVRYVLAPQRKILELEVLAVQKCLKQAGRTIDDIDFVLVGSFMPDQLAVGNAAFLAEKLGIKAPCINIESACNNGLVGLHLASNLVENGTYSKVLVVNSTANHRQFSPENNLRWFLGDGASAWLVENTLPGLPGSDFRGFELVNTVKTNNMFYSTLEVDETNNRPCIRTKPHPNVQEIAQTTAAPYLETVVKGALEKSGIIMENIDQFIFHTPAAHYSDFCGRVLNLKHWYKGHFDLYGNVGACNTAYNFVHAVKSMKPGRFVMLHSIGSSATSAACVYRLTATPAVSISFG